MRMRICRYANILPGVGALLLSIPAWAQASDAAYCVEHSARLRHHGVGMSA